MNEYNIINNKIVYDPKKCSHPLRKFYVKDKKKPTRHIIIKCNNCRIELTAEENNNLIKNEIIEEYNRLMKNSHESVINFISREMSIRRDCIEKTIKEYKDDT